MGYANYFRSIYIPQKLDELKFSALNKAVYRDIVTNLSFQNKLSVDNNYYFFR